MAELDEGTKAIMEKISRKILKESDETWDKRFMNLSSSLGNKLDATMKTMADYCDSKTKAEDYRYTKHDEYHLEERRQSERRADRRLIIIGFAVALTTALVEYLIKIGFS
jgi:hypothetical protein